MDMRFLPFAIATAFATLVAGPAVAQLPQALEVAPGRLPRADVDLILDANTTNITQIAMGHAAESQGANPGIRPLAERIVASHMKANQALHLLASQKHVDLPRDTDIDDHNELADLHSRRAGGDFDAQYIKDVIADHDRMLVMYETARNESVDPDIRRYAEIMVPALRDNRAQALALVNQQPGAATR